MKLLALFFTITRMLKERFSFFTARAAIRDNAHNFIRTHRCYKHNNSLCVIYSHVHMAHLASLLKSIAYHIWARLAYRKE